ncbi:hypothetical protein DPMN_158068 [Dreissena polymorpha]|uniref:Uncharacterized protein n=1 Tax=Dreissena polymorpha TaxID=45954 RepID=A0A9D4IQL0_DREPO|nr:hypothetical protein DPMN_158068 [Dreissena polymorpha]
MLDVCKHNLMQNKRTGSRRKNSGRDPEKDFRHENKTEKERKTTAPINETNGRGASNHTGEVGGENDRGYWRRVDCGVRWCGHVCCAT